MTTALQTNGTKHIGLIFLTTTGCAYLLGQFEKRDNESSHLSQTQQQDENLTHLKGSILNDRNPMYNSNLSILSPQKTHWSSSQWTFPTSFSPIIAHCEAASVTGTATTASWKESTTSQEGYSSFQTEEQEQAPRALSRLQRISYYCGLLRTLPTPRRLTANDSVFDYPQMKNGLKQRIRDENALRNLQSEAIAARQSKIPDRIHNVFMKISTIAYGMSPQEREGFLMRYGCSAWTEEILSFIVDSSKDRGIVEIGAGNGQWARAIYDRSKKKDLNDSQITKTMKDYDDFILAYDSMQELPLSPKVYHSHTQPAHDFFYSKVQTCSSHVEAARRMSSRGRVLLLVYPPPGPMAVETIQAYVDVYPQGNDTVIYVGEGRGGANGDDELFNYFCNSGEWILTKVMDVQKSIKGYERCFCFQRINHKELQLSVENPDIVNKS